LTETTTIILDNPRSEVVERHRRKLDSIHEHIGYYGDDYQTSPAPPHRMGSVDTPLSHPSGY